MIKNNQGEMGNLKKRQINNHRFPQIFTRSFLPRKHEILPRCIGVRDFVSSWLNFSGLILCNLVVTFSLFSLFPSVALGQAQEKIVRRIRIIGNETISTDKIEKVLSLKEGEPYSDANLDKDLKAIFKLGYFVHVTPDVIDVKDGVEVVFNVIEKPMIKRIDIKGNKDFSAKKLLKETDLKTDEPVDKIKMQAAADKLTKFYKDKGYAEAKVEVFDAVDEDQKSATVTFYITEGNKITIEEIRLAGVSAFKPKKILKLMKTKGKRMFRRSVFKAGEFEEDIDKILDFYKGYGYCDVVIEEPEFSYDEEHEKVKITIPVREGKQFFVGRIEFVGNVALREEEFAEDLQISAGDVFDQEKFDATLINLQAKYAERGYARAEIIPELTREDNRINIKFKVSENEIVYINQIYIEGNTRTREPVIRRELEVKPGAPFCLSKIRTSQTKLYRLGYFTDVKLATIQGTQPNTMDLVFTVSEQQTGMLSAGAGYSHTDKIVGNLELSEINLFGRGWRVNVTWEFGKRRMNYRLGAGSGWIFGLHMPFNVSIYDMRRKINYRSTEINTWYRRENRGGDFRLGKFFNTYSSAHLAYTYQTVRLYDFDESDCVKTADGKLQIKGTEIREESSIVSSITPTVLHDNRDSIFNAKKGGLQQVSAEIAGGFLGGSSNFVKTIGEISHFIRLFWKFTLGLHLKAGDLERFGKSEKVPVYERFFVGGAEGVRGYNYYGGEVGPPEGGRLMLVFNSEIKFPLVSEGNQEILQGVIFYDAGNSWDNREEMKKGIFLKQGVGFGVRFVTPAFPIRLDWGYGLNHRPDEQQSQFYFTIGSMF